MKSHYFSGCFLPRINNDCLTQQLQFVFYYLVLLDIPSSFLKQAVSIINYPVVAL